MRENDELKQSVLRTALSAKDLSARNISVKASRESDRNTNGDSEEQSRIGPNLGFLSKEAYNLLRTNLSFSFPDEDVNRGRVIGVTSSIPHEGKSTVALNLAYSLAENNYHVIAVECDFRRPSFAKSLNLPKRDGLSNFLTNRKKSVIYQNFLHENMSVIFAGDTPPNPSELLGSQQMKAILEMLSQKYDYVIVDLPPVNSVSDPLVLSKELDGVLLVVRHNYASRKGVEEAVRQLKFAQARILGFVYNDYIEKDTFGIGYRDKYYSKYGKYDRYNKYKYGNKYSYYEYKDYYKNGSEARKGTESEEKKSAVDRTSDVHVSDSERV